MMIRVAIVEDEDVPAQNLIKYLGRFQDENDLQFEIARYSSGEEFLSAYKNQFDLVLMDIELPDRDGMSVCHDLRKLDAGVIIIFVTNLAQYAVKGYEVDALDFVVKPVAYPVMALKIKRAVDRIKRFSRREGRKITVKDGDLTRSIEHADIKYIEILAHKIIFHTIHGNFKSYGTLKELEGEFSDTDFIRCNSCYLVNLKYVTSVSGYSCVVGGEELQISQPRRKAFIRAINEYMCAED
jgi:DNA-binding LytR/AlgR family response regulator